MIIFIPQRGRISLRFLVPEIFTAILLVFLTSCPDITSRKPPDGMILIPAGTFIMGSKKEDKKGLAVELGMIRPLYLDEHPKRELFLPDFL